MRLLLLALAFLAAPAAAKLAPAEQRIVRTVDSEQARTVALLERLVNQNSGSLNLPGVEAVGRMMRSELEPLGFDVRWVPMAEAGRAGHIVATHKGSGRGRRMLLIGHLDTVFEPDSPFQRFTLKDPNTAEGPGVGDDKGGMVVMVAALRAMRAAGTLKDADIEIVLTGDEEDSGSPIGVARRDLIAAGGRADLALDFEGLAREEGRDMGSIARRGSANWQVTAKGRTGHSSGIFGEAMGNGAIYELARILAAFRSELPEPNLTFNVGLVVGGATAGLDRDLIRGTATGKTNIVPPIAIARGDLRALSLEQQQRVIAKMREIVGRHLPGSDAEFALDEGGYPPMAPTEASRALLARLNAVNGDLGLPAMGELDPLKRGAGDIGFVAHLVPGLIGLGTAGEGSHAPGETIDLTSLPLQAKRAAILMTRLSHEPRGTHPSGPAEDEGRTVRLNQTARIGSVAITPLAVAEESRCPIGVQCIQAGTVRLEARLVVGGRKVRRTVTLGEAVEIEGRRIRLVAVSPAPAGDRTIRPGDYRFTFAAAPAAR